MPTQVFACAQIEEIINFSLDSSKGDYKLPVALWGLAGVGKTEFVTQIAKKRGYNLVVVHLATQGDHYEVITPLLGYLGHEFGLSYPRKAP